jgi:signal transduction histidine kinase
MFRSLRLRMALSHGAMLALIVVFLGGVGYNLLGRSLERSASGAVSEAAREAAERVRGGGSPFETPDGDVPSASAVQVAVFLAGGPVVGERGEAPSWLRPQSTPIATIHAGGEPVRIATLPVRAHGRSIGTVVAARSLAPEDRLLDRVRLLLLLGGLAAVLTAAGAGWLLAGEAVKPVRRAYEAQASFAADASHELRTPLAFIRSGVEVLASQDPALGDDVIREVEYLSGLTDRLLTMARADSGHLALEPRPVDVTELCRRAAARHQRAWGLVANVTAPGPLFALADPVSLEAALDTVLENVARHGGGTAELRGELGPKAVSIRIADHGPGMTTQQRERAFERFYRVDPARTRQAGGAGLGLALARIVVEAQRGSIDLEETAGGGLTVVMRLRPAEGPSRAGSPSPVSRRTGAPRPV